METSPGSRRHAVEALRLLKTYEARQALEKFELKYEDYVEAVAEKTWQDIVIEDFDLEVEQDYGADGRYADQAYDLTLDQDYASDDDTA